MKIANVFIALACLIAVEVEGQGRALKGRCLCAGKGVNMVLPKMIKRVEIIPSSPSCENLEIVVTLKGSEQKCLNLESKFTKNYIMGSLKKRIQQKEPLAV